MRSAQKQGKLLFVTGTDTGVGKTVITAGLLAVCNNKGYRTAAVKPFQTGTSTESGQTYLPDIMYYRESQLQDEPDELLNPVDLGPPASPWVASLLSKKMINLTKVIQAISKLRSRYDLVILEGAGGLAVPISRELLIADFIKQLECPALIVARSTLGTINHTLLSVDYARNKGIPIAGVVVNGMSVDPEIVEKINPWVIEQLSGVPMLGILPFSDSINVEQQAHGNLAELITRHLNITGLEEVIFGKSGTMG